MALKTERTPVPASERIVSSFKQLSSSSQRLNAEIDDWIVSINSLNSSLNSLNLSVSAWQQIATGEDGPSYWTREIGWAKAEDEWQICLRKVSGDYRNPNEESVEAWPFADAPRFMMLDGARKIPELLDTLIKRTDEMAAKISKRKLETAELAQALASLPKDSTQVVDPGGL